MNIKVLGPGCKKCSTTEQIVKDAVSESGIDAIVEKISDPMKIASFGVFGTPAVIINDDVKCVGKVPSKEDVLSWISS